MYLITGASSFSGGHLARHLRQESDAAVVGCSRSNLSLSPAFDDWHCCDVGDGDEVELLIRKIQPDVVFHLAGSTNAADVEELFKTNINGTWNVLHGCHKACANQPRVLLVGSAAEFGDMKPGEQSLGEERPPRPAGMYGYSRHAALELGRLALREWGLRTYLCRPFNLVGPGLPEKYAPAMILKRMAAAKASGTRVFPVSNSTAVRDFIDVRDVVRAWSLIVERGRPGIPYSIGSGNGISIGHLSTLLAEVLAADLEVVDASPPADESRSTSSRSVADPLRLFEDTGFTQQIPLEQSLQDMVNASAP